MISLGRYYLVFCWAFIIFILISAPMSEYEGYQFTYYDKLVHVFLFGIFAYLIVYALHPGLARKKVRIEFILILSFLISMAYAGFSEYIQTFIPGRDTNIFDLLAGAIGIITALLYAYKQYFHRLA
jgi:VanZ family protein